MNKTLKNVGLLAILSLATGAFSLGFIDEVDAISREGIRHDNVQVLEPEPDVELVLKQLFEPKQSHDNSVKSTKGFVPRGDDFDATTYRVVYLVQNFGETDVRNVEILLDSDTEIVHGELQGNLDPKHSTISVLIKAVDPASINAEIIGYEI